MNGAVALVHPSGPIRDGRLDLGSRADAEGQIDIRPAVLFTDRRRAGQRHAGDPAVDARGIDEIGSHAFAVLGGVQG